MSDTNGKKNGKQRKNKGWENLIPCKPGEVRNPKGRPKGVPLFRTAVREMLHEETTPDGKLTLFQAMCRAAIHRAIKGDNQALKLILERLDPAEQKLLIDQVTPDEVHTLADRFALTLGRN